MRNRKRGFTLAELLIVVAIIAVLTAIAIPIFWPKLERSREETDIANMRAARAVGVAEIMDGLLPEHAAKYFDAAKGQLVDSEPAGYGKGTMMNGGAPAYEGYINTYPYTDGYIIVTNLGGLPVLSWSGIDD